MVTFGNLTIETMEAGEKSPPTGRLSVGKAAGLARQSRRELTQGGNSNQSLTYLPRFCR